MNNQKQVNKLWVMICSICTFLFMYVVFSTIIIDNLFETIASQSEMIESTKQLSVWQDEVIKEMDIKIDVYSEIIMELYIEVKE